MRCKLILGSSATPALQTILNFLLNQLVVNTMTVAPTKSAYAGGHKGANILSKGA